MADLEIEDKVWESEVIFIDSIKREGTVYRHVPELKLGPVHRDPDPLDIYCPEGEYYIRFKKSLSAKIGVVEEDSELYLSVHFLDICMDDRSETPYQWQAYRTRQHDRDMFYQPIKDKDGNRTAYGIPIKEMEYRKWKSIVNNHRLGISKVLFKGGYQIPARRRNGRAQMVEMHRNFTGMAISSLWESFFKQATSLWSMNNAGAAFRGIDPKGPMVYILPSSEAREIGRGSNITWTDVKDGFENLPSNLGTKYTVLENSQAIKNNNLVLVGLPFCF